MRSSLVGILAFSLLTAFGSTAFADDSPAKPTVTKTRKKKAPAKKKVVEEPKEPEVDVASTTMPEPVVTLDSVSGTPNEPPPANVTATPASNALYEDKIGASAAPPMKKVGVDPTGWVLSGSLLALAPLTPLVDGGKTPTAGAGIELRFGGYFSSHVGINGGLRLSGGHMLCHDGSDLCNGVGVQLPLMLEVGQSRNDGLYGEVGLGLLTAFLYSQDSSSMRMWTPAVLKSGLGYRIGNLARGDFERKLSVDIRLGADVGHITNYSFEGFTDIKDSSGSVDNPSLFVSAGLSVGAQFSL